MKIFRLANILSFANGITGVFAVFFAASGDYILASRLVVLDFLFPSDKFHSWGNDGIYRTPGVNKN